MKLQRILFSTITALFLNNAAAQNLDYALDGATITINDVSTGITDIKTLFDGYEFEIVTGVLWASIDPGVNSTNLLKWSTSVDGKEVDSGVVELDASRQLPSEIATGVATVPNTGKHTVSVTLTLDDTVVETSEDYMSFRAGVAIIPLIV